MCCLILLSCTRKTIPTLVITGQNNHNWRVSHLAIQKILENTGRFTVSFAITPAEGKDQSSFEVDFSSYQLVVVDYNGDPWSKKTQENFKTYVNKGGGVVVYHAADNSFPEWDLFNNVCALGGWKGRNENCGPYVYVENHKLKRDMTPGKGGSHGAQSEYILKAFNTHHPIMAGLPTHWKHAKDELYCQMRGPGNIKTLLYSGFSTRSKREEPLIFTVDWGKARIFHIMLGHCGKTLADNPAMQGTGFQVLLLRGAEWAAKGEVTQAVPSDFPTAEKVTFRKDYKAFK